MPGEVPILVQHEHDRSHHWRRFVAILCFMEFYVTFVYAGTALWATHPSLYSSFSFAFHYTWSEVPLLVGAALLYLCGRSGWLGRSSSRAWLLVGVSVTSIMVLLELIATVRWLRDTNLAILGPGFAPPFAGDTLLNGLTAASAHIVLLVVMVTSLWANQPANKLLSAGHRPWTLSAAAFCFASIPFSFFGFDSTAPVIGQTFFRLTGDPRVIVIVYSGFVFLLATTGIALLRQWRLARTGALILAALNFVGIWYNWYPMSMLVHVAIRMLRISTPHFPMAEIDDRIWTQYDFGYLFVDSVRLIGPWLLIAIYAWRVPMRMPPDDGTPFPRRFCGNCYYNLHGNDSERCPECGCAIISPG